MEERVFLRFHSYDFGSDRRFQDGLTVLHESSSSREGSDVVDVKLFFYNRFVEPIDRTRFKLWRSASPRVTPRDDRAEQPGSHCDLSDDRAEQPGSHCDLSDDRAEQPGSHCDLSEDRAEQPGSHCDLSEDRAADAPAETQVRGDDRAADTSQVRGDDRAADTSQVTGDDRAADTSQVTGDDRAADTSQVRGDDRAADTSQVRQLSFAEVMRLVQDGQEVPGAVKLDVTPSNQSPTPARMRRKLKPWETSLSSE